MQSPIVTPHSRLLLQQNDELTKLAATYREALGDALAIALYGGGGHHSDDLAAIAEVLRKALS